MRSLIYGRHQPLSLQPPVPDNPGSGSGGPAQPGQNEILKLLGPITRATSTPTIFAAYETGFPTNSDAQWDALQPTPARWDGGQGGAGYDRAAINYVWWVRTGDTKYLDRARLLARDYIDNYLKPSGWAPAIWWSQMLSLYLYSVLENDAEAQNGLKIVAYRLESYVDNPNYFGPDGAGEGRTQMRALEALWMANKLDGSYEQKITDKVVELLGMMNGDGWTPFAATCRGSLNYMNGMVYSLLTRLHDQRPRTEYNATIRTKALAYAAWLWTTQLRDGSTSDRKSFNYVSLVCDGTGGPTPAPDLNGDFLRLFGWCYKETGDPTWKTRGDQLLNGIQDGSLYLYKQLSEEYWDSYSYLGYRNPENVLTSP